jgi:hypothetical protein
MKKQEIIDWLLETEQPAVRFLTLRDLLDRPDDDADVRDARRMIPDKGWAYDVLSTQSPGGYWESEEDLYWPKYSATIWKLIVLSDFGMTANDERIRRSCELFLERYSRPDGGFDTPGSDYPSSEVCLTGNLARVLFRSGYGDDARVLAAFGWIVENQKSDGGWHCNESSSKGTLDCWEGLSAFANLPRERWTRGIKNSIERGAEFYLTRRLCKEGKRSYKPWFRFHYPVHYYYDILVGLDTITALGYADDRRLKTTLGVLRKKRRRNGTWALDAIHPDLAVGARYRLRRTPNRFALEEKGKPSKWITLTALRVLKRTDGLDFSEMEVESRSRN